MSRHSLALTPATRAGLANAPFTPGLRLGLPSYARCAGYDIANFAYPQACASTPATATAAIAGDPGGATIFCPLRGLMSVTPPELELRQLWATCPVRRKRRIPSRRKANSQFGIFTETRKRRGAGCFHGMLRCAQDDTPRDRLSVTIDMGISRQLSRIGQKSLLTAPESFVFSLQFAHALLQFVTVDCPDDQVDDPNRQDACEESSNHWDCLSPFGSEPLDSGDAFATLNDNIVSSPVQNR